MIYRSTARVLALQCAKFYLITVAIPGWRAASGVPASAARVGWLPACAHGRGSLACDLVVNALIWQTKK